MSSACRPAGRPGIGIPPGLPLRRPGYAGSMEDLLELDDQLTPEHRMIRDTVRRFVSERVLPRVGDWFERGVIPCRELAPELGSPGLLGMHLEGYGCAGLDAVSYGVACRELEAGDSGLRSFVSLQGSLATFPIG